MCDRAILYVTFACTYFFKSLGHKNLENLVFHFLTLCTLCTIFSEREVKFMFAICHRRSVCRLSSVCRL